MRPIRRSTIVRLMLLGGMAMVTTGCGDDAIDKLPADTSSASVSATSASNAIGDSWIDDVLGVESADGPVARDASIGDSIRAGYGSVPGADTVTDPTIDEFDDSPLGATGLAADASDVDPGVSDLDLDVDPALDAPEFDDLELDDALLETSELDADF